MPTLVGTKLDKYEIQSEVGHGGMAVVYRGIDTVLSREVAIKVLHPHMAGREESRARLRREAITVAKLRHENILEIYDYSGESEAESYLVTEFIHGMTLREWLDTRWRPRPALAALIIHRLCAALGHAHKSGIVHRDIKPENVMIRSDGCLKLMDFGIAQIIDHQKLTMTGQLLGSPAYMAPELINGKPIDSRTDLFAVGVMLYQLATGELPFSGRNPHEVLARIAEAEYTRPSIICSLVDDELEAIIDRALAREPEQRYQTADDLVRDLERYLDEVGVTATQEEVTAYFTEPDRHVDQLDKRICNALMTRAEGATKAGHSARAIRLLGRVLELERDQKQAKLMLSRLRTRERTVKRLMAGGAALLATAAVSGGAVLLYMTPPTEENFRPGDEGAGGGIVPSTAIRPEHKATKASEPPREEPKVVVEPPTPRKNVGVRPVEPTKATPKAASTTTPCSVRVVGMPVVLLQGGLHSLQIGKLKQPLRSEVVEFDLPGERALVHVAGPKYKGHVTVERGDCRPGTPIELPVKPLKAILDFTGNPQQTTIVCVSGPCPDTRPHLLDVERFPDIDLGVQLEAEIVIEVRAQGYASKTFKQRIGPGRNSFPIALTPL
ncbi:serine/threonine-protein kinase [Nannocystis punicea]|uniref:Serine/threonine-protein kinase n=1 Tax=Nannocystis punicea TaxID=2995304 RepID=A0ABY7HI33_9BACT|nr:serine/threonine-protein kinase [Nannocystis poenicansa]WAS98996.1 serine/threonine-protein kinase [Nannocystis poenicansa]